MDAGLPAEATHLHIRAAAGADRCSESVQTQHSAISIASSGEILSSVAVSRSQVLSNLVAEADGNEYESCPGQDSYASTSLPIHPASFSQWLHFDCDSTRIGDVSPEKLPDLAQVAAFLQDDRTLHCVSSLLAGAMRAGMLACMPPGSEDAPAAYAWQAVVAITEPLKTLPDSELQVVASRFSADEVLGAPMFFLRAWLQGRSGGGTLDLSGFGNRMRGDALAWYQAFARMWSEVASLPITCMHLPIFAGMTHSEVALLQHHCALRELPCITSLHLSHEPGPVSMWFNLLPNLQALHGPELGSNSRAELHAILLVPGVCRNPPIASILASMPLHTLHFDCGVIQYGLFDCLYNGAARCGCLTSLKLPARPSQHNAQEDRRRHVLAMLTGLQELSCPMYNTHGGPAQGIMHALDDVTHLTALRKLTLKGYDSREAQGWDPDVVAPVDISEVMHAVCCTSSKLPTVKSLNFELSHVSFSKDSFGRVAPEAFAEFEQCLGSLDEFTLRESASLYNTFLLFPVLAQIHSVNSLKSVAVYDLAVDGSELIFRPVNWNSLSRLSGLTKLQLTLNSLLPVACARGLADALACMHGMRELDIDVETLWCSESAAESGRDLVCADPTIIPQIACMEHLASLRLHVLQPMHDLGWELAVRSASQDLHVNSHPHACSSRNIPMARSLTSVDLRGVHDKDGADVAAVLSQCSRIVSLSLGNVAFGGTAELGFLEAMPALRVLELELHMSVVVDVALGVLGGMLSALQQLSSLELRCSYLDCVGAEELGRHLRELQALERLELRHLCSDDFEATWPHVLGLRVPMRILREH